MLENIKMLLNLNDSSKDTLILYYINKYTNLILEHCNLKKLSPGLENFIESKIYSILNSTGNLSSENNVKSITRGDTKIEYNGSSSSSSVSSADLTDSDKEFLNRYAMVKLC